MARMAAPESGITVRMYRQGHGDCFLLAARKTDGEPYYMLIDCGLWHGSGLEDGPSIGEVIADIAEATGGRLDAVLVTHEHMDHVNGFAAVDPSTRKPFFDPLHVDKLWLAWTEDGDDDFANELRERFDDTLITLMGADEKLGAAGLGLDSPQREMLRDLLSFETGENAADELRAEVERIRTREPHLSLAEQARQAIAGITNKRAIKSLRDKVEGAPLFLRPDRGPYSLKDVEGVRVYALGPPRDAELLLSMDPKGDEEFRIALDGPSRSLLAATSVESGADVARCFGPRFGVSLQDLEDKRGDKLRDAVVVAYGHDAKEAVERNVERVREFFRDSYGLSGADESEEWRRIDTDWLAGSEALALRLNHEVNNTSLVVAFELPRTGKVLLFTGDAQRGNWISWSPLEWTVDGRKVTARELLGRAVFYKVGHHGSHNATLHGAADDEYANLAWLAQGDHRDAFVAMIPANTEWALGKARPWRHPLEAIEKALKNKARGRVFRTDIDEVEKPKDVGKAEWERFQRTETPLFFEYTVADD